MAELKDKHGDGDLLKLSKVAFLCSRKVPASIILKCYDWAVEQREAGRCVISGFHSAIEKDVFHYLLKGDQPIIMALHRGIGPEIEKKFAHEIDDRRLLIVSPFSRKKLRGGVREAYARNRLMIGLAERVVIGHASCGGELESLLTSVTKPIEYV